jgi:hypothetical protein
MSNPAEQRRTVAGSETVRISDDEFFDGKDDENKGNKDYESTPKTVEGETLKANDQEEELLRTIREMRITPAQLQQTLKGIQSAPGIRARGIFDPSASGATASWPPDTQVSSVNFPRLNEGEIRKTSDEVMEEETSFINHPLPRGNSTAYLAPRAPPVPPTDWGRNWWRSNESQGDMHQRAREQPARVADIRPPHRSMFVQPDAGYAENNQNAIDDPWTLQPPPRGRESGMFPQRDQK